MITWFLLGGVAIYLALLFYYCHKVGKQARFHWTDGTMPEKPMWAIDRHLQTIESPAETIRKYAESVTSAASCACTPRGEALKAEAEHCPAVTYAKGKVLDRVLKSAHLVKRKSKNRSSQRQVRR